ncbi:glycosyltransferase family 4 protein [Pantoea sp. BAV 3049]|uniref:glycosyltransferase family 4 protein n=1 Tax=Pantoea sp. BAV 3049 TaxID=2654188 RepID=UPI001E2A0A6E|nr:glycosyltransferase family 4 protein [Pantoea sp. BAV 3049]
MISQPLHVGYVLKRYPRFSETFVVNEILAHERAGMAIDIFALGPVMEAHFQHDIGAVRAPVSRLPEKQRNVEHYWALVSEALEKLPGLARKLEEERQNSVHDLALAMHIALAVQAGNIQHLHAHFATQAATVARLAAKFSGISWSFTAHAKDIYYRYDGDIFLQRKIDDADHIVTVSDYNLNWLRREYSPEPHKISRIYNGLDLRQFPWSSPYRRPPKIVAAGRLVAKKGFLVLIDAVSRLKAAGTAFHCTLIGEGPLREQLEALIQQAGVGDVVTLTGALPRHQVAEAIQNAAVVVAPCIISEDGDRDGLPTILVEAMALGTPVVSTNIVGIPELVDNDVTGLCVNPNDAEELAQAVGQLLNEPDTRERLARKARDLVVRDYDVDRNAQKLSAVFRSFAL